jgi:N-methylhydantoinase B/oxoprolinase/acetone carboxylase alpha subunit
MRFSADIDECNKHQAKFQEIISNEAVVSVKKILEEIINNARQIQISDFNALQELNKIQEEYRIDLRKKIFL